MEDTSRDVEIVNYQETKTILFMILSLNTPFETVRKRIENKLHTDEFFFVNEQGVELDE
jgi:hypothetical protein